MRSKRKFPKTQNPSLSSKQAKPRSNAKCPKFRQNPPSGKKTTQTLNHTQICLMSNQNTQTIANQQSHHKPPKLKTPKTSKPLNPSKQAKQKRNTQISKQTKPTPRTEIHRNAKTTRTRLTNPNILFQPPNRQTSQTASKNKSPENV